MWQTTKIQTKNYFEEQLGKDIKNNSKNFSIPSVAGLPSRESMRLTDDKGVEGLLWKDKAMLQEKYNSLSQGPPLRGHNTLISKTFYNKYIWGIFWIQWVSRRDFKAD